MFRPPATTPSHASGPVSPAAPIQAASTARSAPASTARPTGTSSTPLATLDPRAFEFFSNLESIIGLVQEGNNPAAVGSAIYDLKKKYDEALALLDRVPDATKSIREVQDQLVYRQEQLCERKAAYHEYHAMASKALLSSTLTSEVDLTGGSGVVTSPATSVRTSIAGDTSSVAPSTLASPTSTSGFAISSGHDIVTPSDFVDVLNLEDRMDVDPMP